MEILIALIIIYYLFLTFLGSIIFHELGHVLYMRKHDKQTHIRVDFHPRFKIATHAFVPDSFSDKQEVGNALSGIVGGLLFILFASIINPLHLVLVPVYLLGCLHDWKVLFNVK